MRWYALAKRPWIEDAGSPEGGYWGLPPGTIGSVDLAPVGGQTHVFVTSDAPFDPTVVEAAIGDGTRLDSHVPNAVEQAAWQTLVGVAYQPGWTLLDLLWETLTAGADPDGVTRAKPIMPTRAGVLELHLGGHSLLRAEKLPDDPTTHPAWPNIQRVLQNDYREIEAQDPLLARKWLGFEQLKYKLSPEAARDLLIPADLPRVLPQPPTTTFTDDFNRADEDLDASANWTDPFGTCFLRSNTVVFTNATSNNDGLWTSSLSGDDHYAKIDCTGTQVATSAYGTIIRKHVTAETYYHGRYSNSDTQDQLYKFIDTTPTLIASAAATRSPPFAIKTEADGSTIRVLVDDVEVISTTDTSITGNLLTGFRWRAADTSGTPGSTRSTVDNWEAADLVAGGANLVRAVGEALGLTGARARAMALARLTAEAEDATETAPRVRALARLRGETEGLAEAGVVARALARLRAEAVGLTETTASIIEALAEAVVRVVSEIIAMAETATRPRRLARIRAELVGIADAVARLGGFVNAAVPVITSRIRMRVGPSTRMNVPPVRRQGDSC